MDPALGRWMVIDPMTEQDRATTPYAYGSNNPMIIVDQDGMFGDFFKEDGTYLGSDGHDDGKLYSVKNDAKIEQIKKGDMLISIFNHSETTDLTTKFGVTYSQFKDLAGTIYDEMTKKSTDWKEGAGIYSVLENRRKLSSESAWESGDAE